MCSAKLKINACTLNLFELGFFMRNGRTIQEVVQYLLRDCYQVIKSYT